MQEVRTYASAIGLLPTTVIQRADAGNGSTWAKWEAGGTATHRTTDKVRSYMAANPVPKDKEDAA
jgi:hypothetical protein